MIKVSELEGAELDYWVGIANNLNVSVRDAHDGSSTCYVKKHGPYLTHTYSPSTNWSQGGAIIEREKITLEPDPSDLSEWAACHGPHDKEPFWLWVAGDTALIAAMRCFVASKFGPEIDDSQAHNF